MTNKVTWITSGIQSVFSSSSSPSPSSPSSSASSATPSRQDDSGERVASHQKQITSPTVNIQRSVSHSSLSPATCSVVPQSSGAIMNTTGAGAATADAAAARPPPYEEISSRGRNARQSERRRSSLANARINITRGVNNCEMRSTSDTVTSTPTTSAPAGVTTVPSAGCSDLGDALRVPIAPSTNNSSTGTTCDVRRALNGVWASRGSSLMGCFFCCVNFYTLSRFSLLAYFFKGPFLLQFFILSLLYGLPIVLFLSSLGQYLGSGFADLWFISPAFKGIGFAFIFAYSVISVYSCVPIAWFFVYFRDSFLSSRETPFRWAYCSLQFNTENCLKYLNVTSYEYVGWSVSSYLHGKILDRSSRSSHMATNSSAWSGAASSSDTGIKADLLLNLGIIWSLLFLCLYQGLYRAGKVIIGASCLSITFFTMVSFRFIETYGNSIDRIFSGTDKPFFLDGTSWLLAAREAFIVWTAFGGAMLTVCSHNKSNHRILHQTLLLFVLVISILLLSACFFASAMEAISRRSLTFYPSSFENEVDTSFLKDIKLLPSNVKASDYNIVSGSNLLIGENLVSSKIFDRESHYGIARFATEIFPAVLACEGPHKISAFWPMIFYLTCILLNLGSLIVLVGSVIDAVINLQGPTFKVWRPTITFITCISGFLFSLPLGTRVGLHFLYYLDFCMASLWWMSLIYLLLVIAVLVIRGRPVGTENLVSMIIPSKEKRKYALPLLTFHWNLITPIFLMILSVSFTRSYSPAGLTWTQVVSLYPHWPVWAQYLSIFLQIAPLSVVFLYGLFKATLLLTMSHKPLHERLQDLFCPLLSTRDLRRRGTFVEGCTDSRSGIINEAFREDPPPKYTPPPSYSAATSRSRFKRNLRIASSSITIDLPHLTQILSQAVSLSSPSAPVTVSSSPSPGTGNMSQGGRDRNSPSAIESQTIEAPSSSTSSSSLTSSSTVDADTDAGVLHSRDKKKVPKNVITKGSRN